MSTTSKQLLHATPAAPSPRAARVTRGLRVAGAIVGYWLLGVLLMQLLLD